MANMYFGVPGAVKEIPCPDSGLGFNTNSDSETTTLVSGGQSVWRPATAYKTFDMSWRSTSEKLRTIIAMYNGQFGPGPFYMTDPTADASNVLPARWSNSWQLAHQANGWCRPVVEKLAAFPNTVSVNDYFTDRQAVFTQTGLEVSEVVRTNLVKNPSFEVGTTGVTASAVVTLSTTTTSSAVYTGTKALNVAIGASATTFTYVYQTIDAFAGQWIAFQTSTRRTSGSQYAKLGIGFYDNTNTLIGSINGSSVFQMANTSSGGNRSTFSAQAPSGSVTARLFIYYYDDAAGTVAPTNGTAATTDGWHAASGTTQSAAIASAGTYFDGDTANSTTEVYRWSDTAHNSTSLALKLSDYAASGKLKTRTIRVPGKDYWFAVDGDTTNGAAIKIRGFSQSGATWVDLQTITNMDGVSRQVTGLTSDMTMLELDIYMPLFSTLKLRGMCLSNFPNFRPGTLLRTNHSLNPRGVTPGANFGVYLAGTSETGTSTFVTGASDGPTGLFIASYYRRSVTAPKTAGSTGWRASSLASLTPLAGLNGQKVTVSIYFRYTGTGTLPVTMRATTHDAAGTQLTFADTPLVTCSSGVWYRLSATVTATADFANIGWWAYHQSLQIPPAGSTIDVTGLMVELSPVLTSYFDGSISSPGTEWYYWEGTVNTSRSFATDEKVSDYMPVGQGVGALQFTESGQGTLVSTVIDRIGLSLGMTEVQQVERVTYYG